MVTIYFDLKASDLELAHNHIGQCLFPQVLSDLCQGYSLTIGNLEKALDTDSIICGFLSPGIN